MDVLLIFQAGKIWSGILISGQENFWESSFSSARKTIIWKNYHRSKIIQQKH